MIIQQLLVLFLTIFILLQIIKMSYHRYMSASTSYASTSHAPTSHASTSYAYVEGATTMTEEANKASSSPQYTNTGLDNDPLYLAKTNAANIAYLKSKVDELLALKQQVSDLSGVVQQNSTGITNISQQLSNTAYQMVGRDPNSTEPLPTPTGLD
jgi:hypothetical protein